MTSRFLVQQGATVRCAHGGEALSTAPNPRVTVSGRVTYALTGTWTVAGCPLPASAGGPCVAAAWTTGSARVLSLGRPLVVQGGTATCVPTGAPLLVLTTQNRVRVV